MIFFDNIREGRFTNRVLRVPPRYYSIVCSSGVQFADYTAQQA